VKIFLFILFMCLLSALLIARDLNQVAKAERQRRQAVIAARNGGKTPTFTNRDLKGYHQNSEHAVRRKTRRSSVSASSQRDLSREQAYWQKEKEKHRRELARLDARIRRLEWRLAERKARKKLGGLLREDPAERALEETLESMEEEKRRLISEFLERGRKAGALPGWLR
jgi:hypothetical protein